MIKKISKIMWIVIITFVIFAVIVAVLTNNALLLYLSGQLFAIGVFVQLVLIIIGLFTKKSKKEESD